MHSSSLRTSTRSKVSPARGSCFLALSAYETSVSRRSSSGNESKRLMILFSLVGYIDNHEECTADWLNWNIGLWPVRPADMLSAVSPNSAECNSAGRTDCKSMFLHAPF